MSINKKKLFDPYSEDINESEDISRMLDSSDILVVVANYLVNYRLNHNLTQKEFADLLGMQQTMVSKLESGSYNPSFKMILKISYAISGDEEVFLEIVKKIEEKLNSKKLYKDGRLNKKIYEYDFNTTVKICDYFNKKSGNENKYRIG